MASRSTHSQWVEAPARQQKIAARPEREVMRRRIRPPSLIPEKTMLESRDTMIPYLEKEKSHSMEEFTQPMVPQTIRRPGPLEELGGCRAPDWVEDKAKYRDMCKHFRSEVRKAKVDAEAFDFDQELYDDELSRDAIRERIQGKVWGAAQAPEADERLSQIYEERMEIPRREYDRLLRVEGERDGFAFVVLKQKNCFERALSVCRRVGRAGYGILQKEVKALKKECPGNYRGILRKKK